MKQSCPWEAHSHSVKKFPAFYGTVFTRARHWSLSWATWIRYIRFPLPTSFQSFCPIPRSYVTFRNKRFFFTEKSCLPLAEHQGWRPPLVGWRRVLIQYIRSYLPYLEAATRGCAMQWWQGPTQYGGNWTMPLNNLRINSIKTGHLF